MTDDFCRPAGDSGSKQLMTVISEVREPPFREVEWDLSELLSEPAGPEVERRLRELDQRVRSFEGRRAELTPEIDPAALVAILEEYESLFEEMRVLSAYGRLRFAADTQSAEPLNWRNRIEHALTALYNRVLFFTLWWKGLDEEPAAALLERIADPDHRHFLADLRRLKPFTLDERSEQIINHKNANGVEGLLTLHSMLTSRLEFELEVDGERRTMTRDELSSHYFSNDAAVRAAAYRELFRVIDREAAVLGQIYVHRVRDWHTEYVEVRGFDSALAVRNTINDIPGEAVAALLEAVAEHGELFRRYFRLKAGFLGLDRLRRYDVYASLAASERRIPYDDAVRQVLATLADFHPQVAELAARVFEHGHIDAQIRKGKKGGAFCATVLPRQTPWLLLNYTGRVRDVATLAHELGHAVHSMMAAEHSVLTQSPSLPLAETASVFAEMLLTERLLEREKDPGVRRELLASAVDDFYGTIMRQSYFVRFEMAAHRALIDGASAADLDQLYLDNLSEQFGASVEVAPEFAREWLIVPHFYLTPFYCYAYSFGQLLVLALYQRFKREGESFVPGYLRLLGRGGSARPMEILAEAGVDAGDPDFWRGGFEVVAAMIDELEALPAD